MIQDNKKEPVLTTQVIYWDCTLIIDRKTKNPLQQSNCLLHDEACQQEHCLSSPPSSVHKTQKSMLIPALAGPNIMMSSICCINVQCPGMVRSSKFLQSKLQHKVRQVLYFTKIAKAYCFLLSCKQATEILHIMHQVAIYRK